MIGGVGDERDDEYFDKKKYPPTLDLAIHSLKYEVSMYTSRTMSLECYRMVASGWLAIYWRRRLMLVMFVMMTILVFGIGEV